MRMNSKIICFVVFLIFIKTAKSHKTKPYKLYDVNMRVGGTTESKRVRSLLECSTLFDRSENSLSFNYNPVEKVCELSSNYPEDQAEAGEGWKVYSPIVDGAWSGWTNWGVCTVDCGGGTRTRTRTCTNPSPSNGGMSCPDHSSETESCNEHMCIPVDGAWSGWSNWDNCTVDCGGGVRNRTRNCTNPSPSNGGLACPDHPSESEVCNERICVPGYYSGNYFISTFQVNWDDAKMACVAMSASLVIIDISSKQSEIETIFTSLNLTMAHWIGLRCNVGLDCTWVDGTSVDAGYSNWAPNEPKDRYCVWMGLDGTTKWDDNYCPDRFYEFICEF